MKPRRFSFHDIGLTHNCNECARVIVPSDSRYFDQVSGHIVHHVECHQKYLERGHDKLKEGRGDD